MRVAREEARLSERRACGLMGMHRGSCRYRRREAERYGVASAAAGNWRASERASVIGGCMAMLRRERRERNAAKWVVNHKRVYRIYREEGLAMRRKKAQTIAGRSASAAGAAHAGRIRCGRWTSPRTAWRAGGVFAR